MKVGVLMDNLIRLRPDQMIKAWEAAKKFGYARKKAKDMPQFITENGTIDSVLMDYEYYLKMYQRLVELEAKEDTRVLNEGNLVPGEPYQLNIKAFRVLVTLESRLYTATLLQ